MNLAKLAVKRPVTALMGVLIVISFGLMSVININMDLMPNIDIPIAVVFTSFDGAGSEEVENLITSPLEQVLGTVAGLSDISSTSSNGSSVIMLQFEDGTNIDIASLDMRERIDMIRPILPDGAGDPMVMQIDIDSMATLTIGITSEHHDLVSLNRIIEDRVASQIERQDGVASVNISGAREREIAIILDNNAIRGYGLSAPMIAQSLMMENISIPIGELHQGSQVMQVRVSGEFDSIEDIRNIPLTTAMGGTVFLQDVATIEERFVEASSAAFINGIPSITLTIERQSTANTVNVSDNVMRVIDSLQQELPELDFMVLLDPADFIRMALSNVVDSALQGGLFAVIILYIFLRNVRSTFVIATAMPISIIATFVLMYYADITINFMSLGGLTLGLGLLVDNSIIVLESIYRKIEQGVDSKKAAVEGTGEVAMSIIAATLTTIAVFLPITFAGGLVAQIFNQLSLTIAFSLFSSLIVSLTFVPMLCSIILTPRFNPKKNVITKTLDKFGDLLGKLEGAYKVLLAGALKRKGLTLAVTAALVVGTLYSLNFVGMEFMPTSDEGVVNISAQMPRGTMLSETQNLAFQISDIVSSIPEVQDIIIQIGGGGMMGGAVADRASLTLNLTDRIERGNRTSQVIATEIDMMLRNIPGANISVTAADAAMGGFGGGAGVQLNITGDDMSTLRQISNDLVEILDDIPGLRQASTSLEEAAPQATVRIDRIRAASLGVATSTVTNTLRTAVTGTVATTYRVGGVEYDVRIIQGDQDMTYLNDLENIFVQSSTTGLNIPLSAIADIVVEDMPTTISRENQRRVVSVTAHLDNIPLNVATAEIEAALASYIMPEGYDWSFGGSAVQMEESFENLILALILAIALIYMILAAEFESFTYPLIVMFSIPVALTGGLFGLFLTGETLSITSFVGLIMLAGIVINNAIVLIDYTNFLVREEKLSLLDALLKAGPIRLRPILMTTLSTVLALTPMALSQGDGAEIMRGLAIVVIFGLLISTLITLVLVPVVYMMITSRVNAGKEKRAAKRLAASGQN